MTNREVFDRVKNHLLTQGKKSLIDGHRCVYRSPEGLKCAVGCLISDGNYSEKLESLSVHRLAVRNALIRSLEFKPNMELLGELQRIHDKLDVDMWPQALDNIEREYFDGNCV